VFKQLLFLTIVFSLLSPVLVHANDGASVEILLNGYDGETPLTASLINFSFETLESKNITSSPFTFTGLNLSESYTIVLDYKGIPYSAQVNTNQTSQQVKIELYDVTSSDEKVIVSFHHISLARKQNSIVVAEVIEFFNSDTKVLKDIDIKISLPKGYSNLTSSQSSFLTVSDFGYFFRLPSPIKPNQTQVIDLTYVITPSEYEYKLVQRPYYDTQIFIVTTKVGDINGDLKINSYESMKSYGDPIDIGGSKYDAYSTDNIYAGESVSASIIGYKNEDLTMFYAGTGVIVLLLISGVAFGFRNSKFSSKRPKSEEDDINNLLSKLEQDFKEGKIKEIEYLKQRLEYKQRLENTSTSSNKKSKSEEDEINNQLSKLEQDFKEGKIKEIEYLKQRLEYKQRLENIQSLVDESSER